MIAKNNLFNIRTSGSQWFGTTGYNRGFVCFESKEYSIRAVAILLRTYRRKGFKTVYDIINRYAPSSENDTPAYVRYISEKLDVLPFEVLSDDGQYVILIKFLALYETNTRLCVEEVWSVLDKYKIKICE